MLAQYYPHNARCTLYHPPCNPVYFPVDSTSDFGITPLHLACLYGHQDIAMALVHAGADKYLTTSFTFGMRRAMDLLSLCCCLGWSLGFVVYAPLHAHTPRHHLHIRYEEGFAFASFIVGLGFRVCCVRALTRSRIFQWLVELMLFGSDTLRAHT